MIRGRSRISDEQAVELTRKSYAINRLQKEYLGISRIKSMNEKLSPPLPYRSNNRKVCHLAEYIAVLSALKGLFLWLAHSNSKRVRALAPS